MQHYLIRECERADCRFRFPAAEDDPRGVYCPHCGAGKTAVVARADTNPKPVRHKAPDTFHLELLLDNIRSVYNVGSLLRTADGAGVRHLHFCGITATPEHPRLAKTALGAEQLLPWTRHLNAVSAVEQLRATGYLLWGLEEDPRAENLLVWRRPTDQKAVLIIGNEKMGIDPEIRLRCDRLFSLPMLGGKHSLNVAVAAGIALYHLRFGQM